MPINTSDSVSIVIPVFNEQENLPELMRRTLAVGRALIRPFEIILVDDGSRDASRNLIAEAVEAALNTRT
jgi:undecaprenyl-phosphate 4-deoxy-4-formamido-L-arabinose transferase